jgi:hypothetical protein
MSVNSTGELVLHPQFRSENLKGRDQCQDLVMDGENIKLDPGIA